MAIILGYPIMAQSTIGKRREKCLYREANHATNSYIAVPVMAGTGAQPEREAIMFQHTFT